MNFHVLLTHTKCLRGKGHLDGVHKILAHSFMVN